jgi:hypothetical protein
LLKAGITANTGNLFQAKITKLVVGTAFPFGLLSSLVLSSLASSGKSSSHMPILDNRHGTAIAGFLLRAFYYISAAGFAGGIWVLTNEMKGEVNMNSLTKSTLVAASLLCLASVAGCGERSAETAGRKIDQTTEKAENKMNNAQAQLKEGADKAEATVSDAALTAKIKGALIGEPGVKAMQINVDTSNGKVILSGTVSSPQEAEKAQQIAQQVEGVQSVENHLVVKST